MTDIDMCVVCGPNGHVPVRHNELDAGYDLFTSADTVVPPCCVTDVPTDIRVGIAATHWLRITGRSSTLRRYGIMVVEGVVDAGYTGKLFIQVYNLTSGVVTITRGSRIAQIIMMPLVAVQWTMVDSLRDTSRGDSGFGSSGK